MDSNDPQVHIGLAIGHLQTSNKYQPDGVNCQRAQAEAQIAQAMLLSGIGAQLVALNKILNDAMHDTQQSKSSKF